MGYEVDLDDFLRPEEITQDYLEGVVDETKPRQREIIDLLEPKGHDMDVIPVRVFIHQRDRQGDIVGFGDRYIRVEGLKVEEKRVSPFTWKNAKEFGVDSPHLELDGDGMPMVSETGVAEAIQFLENLRRNLMINAMLTALNERKFTYSNGDITLTIDFKKDVIDEDGPGTDFESSSVDPYYETDMLKERFYLKTGQIPDLVLVKGKTSANLKTVDEIGKSQRQQQPSDPESHEDTFEEWTFNGLTFRVLRDPYPTPSGLKGPIDEGVGIVTVRALEENGESPLQMHRASTKLNGRDASGPSYRGWVDDEETSQYSFGGYDNMLPGIAKRGIVQSYKFYTPSSP